MGHFGAAGVQTRCAYWINNMQYSVSGEKAVRWPQGKMTVFWRGDCYILTSAWCFAHSKQVKQRQHDGGCLNSCSIGEIRWKLRCWKISQRCQQLPDNLPHLVCHQVCFLVEGKLGGSTLWTIGPADSLIEICSWLWVGKNLCWILKLFVSNVSS